MTHTANSRFQPNYIDIALGSASAPDALGDVLSYFLRMSQNGRLKVNPTGMTVLSNMIQDKTLPQELRDMSDQLYARSFTPDAWKDENIGTKHSLSMREPTVLTSQDEAEGGGDGKEYQSATHISDRLPLHRDKAPPPPPRRAMFDHYHRLVYRGRSWQRRGLVSWQVWGSE